MFLASTLTAWIGERCDLFMDQW